jgi:uncharacterized protein
MDAATLALLCSAAFLGAASQSLVGFGFALVCAPVAVTVLGAHSGVRLVNEMNVVVNLLLLLRERHGLLPKQFLRLLAPACVVTPATAFIVHRIGGGALLIAAGAVIVVTAGSLAVGFRTSHLKGNAGITIAGAVSAAMNATAGVAGPAIAVYAVNADWTPESMRSTLQLYFLTLNLFTIVALGPLIPSSRTVGLLLPCLVVGLVGGGAAARRLPRRAVSGVVIALAIIGGMVAIGRGIAS